MNYLEENTRFDFKSVLDIGTGFGYLLKKFEKTRYCDGIESNPFKTKFAVSKNVRCAYFDENFEFDKKYDLICLTQVLPYLRETSKVLENVKKYLNPDGLIFIVTVNPDAKYLIDDYKNSTHESYYCNMIFSKKNFEMLKEEMGLEILDYTTYRSDMMLDFLHNNKILTFIKYRLNLKKPLVLDVHGDPAMILLKNQHIKK